ncbi:MAG TPA: DUF349 domain-containing protein [Mycobacteriales bacterium]|nr:DUF349 domain-containing protein [Mycobacteriales bacterium]
MTSSEWGRIDADGTVWVKTESGERQIGSWQAGDPAAGLAHYERRYEDLATEVELLEQRLASGAGDPAATLSHAATLRESLATAAVIGDLGALDRRLAKLTESAHAKADEAAAARARSRQEAVAAKERLVAEAESLADSTHWKATGDRFKAIVEEWKAIRGVDRRTDATLWKRFAVARDTFTRHRGSHFAELDKQRHAAKVRKEELVAEAEALADSADWGPTAARLKQLMGEWKAAGRATKDAEEQLWQKFRAAQDRFFARRSEVYGERSAEQHDNLQRKEAVIAEAEAVDLSDVKAAQARLRELQDAYDRIGHVPREAMRGLDTRMRAAEQRIREAVDAQWRRASVTSNPVLMQLRDAVAKAETQLAKAQANGDPKRIADAEANLAARREWLAEAERSAGS